MEGESGPVLFDPDEPWISLREALEAGAPDRLVAIFEELSLSDGLRALLQLEPDERTNVLTALPPDLAAELITEAPNEQAVDLVGHLDAGDAAEIIEELDSDIQADVVGELEQQDAEAILAEMEPEEAAEVMRLVEYADDTAGGLMIGETFSFPSTDTVGAVIHRLTSEEEDFERYRGQHPYIVDEDGRLIGVVSLRNLLTARRSTALPEIMAEPLSVTTETKLEEIQDLLDEHEFLGLPVVDAEGRLVGTVSRSAVADALLERSESESLKRQGVFGDELRSMPLLLRSRRRLAWLSANIVLNVIAASVISFYEQTLAAVIAIAIFLPMVSDMSGCSGNQSVAVSLRELALGLAKPVDVFRVWAKEVSVGVINGVVLGILIAVVAWLWKGNAFLGIVIGLALAINTVIAVSIGGVVPLLLKKLNQDPAVASGPLLTTITDVAGFFLVLSLATLMMPLLV
ncbi:MAG: magnesium transporter [Bauldia sp.]|nr:magnesium transporter [Bauldia sp.]